MYRTPRCFGNTARREGPKAPAQRALWQAGESASDAFLHPDARETAKSASGHGRCWESTPLRSFAFGLQNRTPGWYANPLEWRSAREGRRKLERVRNFPPSMILEETPAPRR